MLVEIEETVTQLPCHGECKISCTYAHRQVWHLPFRLGDDSIPLFCSYKIVIIYKLIGFLVVSHWNCQDSHASQYDGKSRDKPSFELVQSRRNGEWHRHKQDADNRYENK